MKDKTVSQQSFLQKFLSGGAWSLFVRFFAEISSLVISMILARLLAPEQVGIYFLLVSMVSVVVIFSLLGLNVAIVRIIARSMATGKEGVVRTALTKSRLTGLGSSLIIASILYFFGLELLAIHVFKENAVYDLRLLVAIWIVLWTLEDLNAEIFRGFKQFHLAVLFKKLAPNIIILVVSALIFFSNLKIGLDDYLGIVLFAWLCSVVFSSILLKKRFINTIDKSEQSSISLNSLLSMSMPLWFTVTITFALPHLDLWVLAAIQSSDMVALYGAASRLILIIAMPLFIVQAVVPPLIAEAHAAGKVKDLSNGLRAIAAMAFFPGLLVCLAYMFAGDLILVLVFGEYYADSYLILKILTVGVMVRLFAASSQSLLTMTGHGKTTMMIALCSGVIVLFGCWYAGLIFGMTGVAVAATIGMSIHSLLNFLFARIHTGLWVFPMFSLSRIKRPLSAV